MATCDYRVEFARAEINQNGWMFWPPVRVCYETVINEYPSRWSGAGE